MNHSVNSSSTLEHPDVLYATSFVTLLLVPPINIYVLLLIVRGGLETITSEFYCLNLAVSDIVTCFFFLFYVIYSHLCLPDLHRVVKLFKGFLDISYPLFQGCICVERYLAVVHPVIFLRYKLLRYKVMCSSVVWLSVLAFSVAYIFSRMIGFASIRKVLLGFYIVLLSLMLFFCGSVLWALKQPGPGEGRRQRAEGYDAKRRAFNIMMTTTVITVINYLPYVVILTLYGYINPNHYSLGTTIAISLRVYSGLLAPLFYLQRAGKLSPLNFLQIINK